MIFQCFKYLTNFKKGNELNNRITMKNCQQGINYGSLIIVHEEIVSKRKVVKDRCLRG